MNCGQFDDILADYLGNELDPAGRAAAQQHVQSCAVCRELADGLQRAAAAIAGGPPPTEKAVRATAGLSLPVVRPRRQRRFAGGAVLRYAAAILIAFGAGYALRGVSTTGGPPGQAVVEQPQRNNRQTLERRYREVEQRYAHASGFTRSMLLPARR